MNKSNKKKIIQNTSKPYDDKIITNNARVYDLIC